MTAVSRSPETAYRGVDLTIALTYTPPVGESRDGLAITAALYGSGARKVDATSLVFDPATGSITATWQEATTLGLVSGGVYEARFVRAEAGSTRVFYIRPVKVI